MKITKVTKVTKTHEVLLDEFHHHLRDIRGLVDGSCNNQVRYAREFLCATFPTKPVRWPQLRPPVLVDYVVEQSGRCRPSTLQSLASALRSFLRFGAMKGWTSCELVAAVPKVKGGFPGPVPNYLTGDQLELLLGELRRQPAVGLRNFALGLSLVQLGLRAGEASRLTLEDIDWRHGLIRLPRTKNRRAYQLPMPQEAGQAMADYLRKSRPPTELRQVFVTCGPRVRPLSTGAISNLVATAMSRAGIQAARKGAHVLRHTLASQLVQTEPVSKKLPTCSGTWNFQPRPFTPR